MKYYEKDVLRKHWDDENQMYTEWDENGNVVISRPYNTEENNRRDAARMVVAEEVLHDQVYVQINDIRNLLGVPEDEAGRSTLYGIINTPNAIISASPAPYIIALARIMIRIARAGIRMSRYMVRDLSSPLND